MVDTWALMLKSLYVRAIILYSQKVLYLPSVLDFIAFSFENNLSKFRKSLEIILLKDNSMRFAYIGHGTHLTQGKENQRCCLEWMIGFEGKPRGRCYHHVLEPS